MMKFIISSCSWEMFKGVTLQGRVDTWGVTEMPEELVDPIDEYDPTHLPLFPLPG
jgi:hypothetical protein